MTSTPMTGTPVDIDREHLRWETALDRLELDVIRAEQLLARRSTEVEAWDEPRVAGPIPADLVERALALRARQQQVQEALIDRLGALRRQHAFTDRVRQATRRAEVPVYLDLQA